MEKFGIELIDTKFSYSVKYGDRIYAHDFDSDLSDREHGASTKTYRPTFRTRYTSTGLFERCIGASPMSRSRTKTV